MDETPVADARIFNQFGFKAQGLTEGELDIAIEAKMTRHLTDAADWTIVQKQMSLAEIQVGESNMEMVEAEVMCIRVAGTADFDLSQ
jgi:hypothetical protein